MIELIPQQAWRELNEGLNSMSADVDKLAAIENHDVDSLQRVLAQIREKLNTFDDKFQQLNGENKCFHNLCGHDVGNSSLIFGLNVINLHDKYKEPLGKRIRDFLGKSSRIEELDESFYEKLYVLALDFCREKGAKPKGASRELRAMLKQIASTNEDFSVSGSLRDLEEYLLRLVDHDLAKLPQLVDDQLLEIIRDVFGKAEPAQGIYDHLYGKVEEFCLSDVKRREDIPGDLKEEAGVVGRNDYDLIYIKQEIDAMRADISKRVAVICTNFWKTNMAIKSMQHWVEDERLASEEVDLDKFFNQAKPVLQQIFAPGNVDFEVEPGLKAKMNEGTIGNLLVNMAKNAQRHGAARNLKIRVFKNDEAVKLEVTDDGSGLDGAIVGKIFDEGFSSGQGKGLGLAKAKERLEAIGGEIEVEGRGGIDGGAKFVMKICNLL